MELVLELDPGLLMDNRKGADVEELLRETCPNGVAHFFRIDPY